MEPGAVAGWVDAHCHLAAEEFSGDIAEVIARAKAAGIARMVVNAARPGDWGRTLALAAAYREITPAIGVHPWFVDQASEAVLEQLEQTVMRQRLCVGEIGLDRWIEPRDEAAQERVFRRQLALARTANVPAMIHCLRAWDWLLDVLAKDGGPKAGIVIHAYGGGSELVASLAKFGAYFSFAGNTLEEKRRRAREALRVVPGERLLVETDSPDMRPPAAWAVGDGTRNEPAALAKIGLGLAEARGIEVGELRRLTTENATRLLAACGGAA